MSHKHRLKKLDALLPAGSYPVPRPPGEQEIGGFEHEGEWITWEEYERGAAGPHKAHRVLASARHMLEECDPESAIDRACYAAFQRSTAVLLGEGERSKRHSGTRKKPT